MWKPGNICDLVLDFLQLADKTANRTFPGVAAEVDERAGQEILLDFEPAPSSQPECTLSYLGILRECRKH